MSTEGSTHWCYRCERFVHSRNHHIVICPDCGSGFIEELDDGDSPLVPLSPRRLLRASHSPFAPSSASNFTSAPPRRNRSRRRGAAYDQPPSFNPVIVLRNESGGGDEEREAERRNYQLYYDDGAGLGLRPLPVSISEFLMGSGFDRLLDQLSHMDLHGARRLDNPPAAKSAVESMPVVKIVASQVAIESSHCAVCKEEFEIDDEAREMPCKHIYHADCILPWLSLRNSCPVCRFELPAEAEGGGGGESDSVQEESPGLTIWRLPGGGFAVGRFAGGRRLAERELPAVYTEMDGRFNENGDRSGAPRRITWDSTANRSGEGRGLGRVFRSVVSFFRRGRNSGSQLRSDMRLTGRSRSNSILRRRQREEWTFGV